MQIKNSFEVALPPDEAWKVLMDIPRIASCVPGAELVGRTDDGGYKGKVSVRLGPVALSFGGVAHIVFQDDAARHAKVKAGGQDVNGRGGASADLTFDIAGTETGSRADIVTDVILTGPVAQYGRGTGVIQSVATQIVKQFAANLGAMIEQDKSGAAQPGSSGPQVETVNKPISAFSLLLSVIREKLHSLFSRS